MSAAPDSSQPKLLILGGPSSGKSTYRAQVYQRFEHQPGDLRLVKSVGDRSAIENDIDRIVQGLQPMHTAMNTYQSTTFVLADGAGHQHVLEFADYDGEQVRKMASANQVPATWVERAQQAESWLLFLRIDTVRPVKSFMTSPVAAGPKPKAATEAKPTPAPAKPTETNAIEMLQRLLFVRGASLRHPLSTPRLAVLLSCWDELAETERAMAPADLLESRAPLFSRFLAANWHPDQLRLWGLTSTEQPLPETDPNANFALKGPEKFGYIVTGAGQTDRDLTIPIGWLLQPRP